MTGLRELDRSIARLRRRYPVRSRAWRAWRAGWPLVPAAAWLAAGLDGAMPARPPGVWLSVEYLYIAVLLAAALGDELAAAIAANGAAAALAGAYLWQATAPLDPAGLVWLAAHLGCLTAIILFFAIRWQYTRLAIW